MRSTLLRPVLAMQQEAVERDARFDDPARLRAERDSLAAYLVGQAAITAENRQLREMLGLRQRLPPSFVPAEIVRIPGRAAEGFFHLTAGAGAGVQAGAPIVAAEGLVGRVRNVDDRQAFGIDWMHPEFRASAMTADGAIYGIVEPRRGPGGEPMLALTGTPRHIDLDTGALIVTSGHGGVFPPGIPIGTVAGLEGEETSWQRSYLVRPLVGPSEMAYVLVLGGPQEALGGASLAATWGIRPVANTPPDSLALPGAEAGFAPAGAAGASAGGTPRQSGPRLLGTPVRPSARDTTNVN